MLLLSFESPKSVLCAKNCKKYTQVSDTVVINFIKAHEGWNNGYSYTCQAGYKTIGYGHVVKSNESFIEPLNQFQADSLLLSDFEKSKKSAKRNFPKLKGNRLLAVSHLIYCKGIGTVLKKELVKNNQLDTVKLLNMNYRENRMFEKNLFYN